jgi:fructosamine-3-kinase
MPAPDALAAWLRDRLGVELVGRRPVSGGCIHRAWRLDLADGGRMFAKTAAADALPLLEAEAAGLRALATAAGEDGPRLPVPLALGQAGASAVLVLSWHDLGGAAAAGAAAAWQQLGGALARLHRGSLGRPCLAADRPAQAYGWPHDNFIGSSPQANGWEPDWGRFFLQRRLEPQLEALSRRAGPLRSQQALLVWAGERLAHHHPEPCLVHGDLWSGNAAISSAGQGMIFDPAVYRGDREVDLAMARLFGGFPAAFFVGYELEWPLPQDHGARGPLYNLYHLLNHANLFGGGYWDRCQSCVDALLAGSEP